MLPTFNANTYMGVAEIIKKVLKNRGGEMKILGNKLATILTEILDEKNLNYFP